MQVAAAGVRAAGQRLGLVPTMGALHEGHLSLVRRARQECDVTVVSIFVNPTQFGPGEDYRNYPRDFEHDKHLLENEGVDLLFAPTTEEMYPDGFQTTISIGQATTPLEGKFRPGHFDGVATVVAKLFNVVLPDKAYFGRKDAQQCVVIQRMVRDLNFPVAIIVRPTVREPDGLAMSSRNAYLNAEERKAALTLYRALRRAKELLEQGERCAATLEGEMRALLEAEPLAKIDYAAVVDAETLQPLATVERDTLVALAVRIGRTRLIDNLQVGTEGGRLTIQL